MPKISILIPVYKVEQYIERCVRSLFEQTFDDIEYIFVDDCSPDNSIKILQDLIEEYPSRKGQVKILRHDKNTGLAIVRKEALLAASGDFIVHCDSDDWLDLHAIEDVYTIAIKEGADMVLFDYYETDGTHHSLKKTVQANVDTDTEALRNSLLRKGGSPYVWNKLFKRDLICHKEIEWPIGYSSEDWTICVELACFCNKIIYFPHPYYYYYFNGSSITMDRSEANLVQRQIGDAQNSQCLEKFFDNIGRKNDGEEIVFLLKMVSKWQLGLLVGKHKYYVQWKKCFPEVNLNSLIKHHYGSGTTIRYLLQYFRLYPFFKTHFGSRR